MLENVGATTLGVVLNGVSSSKGGAYYGGYGYGGYGYASTYDKSHEKYLQSTGKKAKARRGLRRKRRG